MALYTVISVLVFVLGACVGSFLNVCIHRIPRDESVVAPRSHCPHCGHLIAWYDNIPLISWVVLGAKCRHCGEPISSRYVLVEFLVAVLFFLIWMEYGMSVFTPVYWIVAGGLVVATFVDFEHYIIPDRISLGGVVLGVILSFLFPVLHSQLSLFSRLAHWQALLQSAYGILAGAGTLWLVAKVGRIIFKKDAMGMGDVKLLGAIGAFMGWRAVAFSIVVSSFVGSVVGIVLILLGGKEWQSKIPYGPYLALGALLWIFFGADVWNAYLHWMAGG